MKFRAPFMAIPMPIDRDGNGPVDPTVTITTLQEVWDGTHATVCSCFDVETAQFIAKLLNENAEKQK